MSDPFHVQECGTDVGDNNPLETLGKIYTEECMEWFPGNSLNLAMFRHLLYLPQTLLNVIISSPMDPKTVCPFSIPFEDYLMACRPYNYLIVVYVTYDYLISLCQIFGSLTGQDRDARRNRSWVPHCLPYILLQPEGNSDVDMGRMWGILSAVGT
jgi:hypothetical protein